MTLPAVAADVRGELGEWAESMRLYEAAVHGLGIPQQQLGKADAARASFTRFIVTGKGRKASLEDAKKGLEPFGS